MIYDLPSLYEMSVSRHALLHNAFTTEMSHCFFAVCYYLLLMVKKDMRKLVMQAYLHLALKNVLGDE